MKTTEMKKRKPLDEIELREGFKGQQSKNYFTYRELFPLDPLIKHLRNLKKPASLFSMFSLPNIEISSFCFCKYCFALGMCDGTVVIIDPAAGDLITHSIVIFGISID